MNRVRNSLGVFLITVSGCHGIDTRDAEEKVRNIAEQTMKAPVASVKCPEARREAGVVVECEVTFVEGGTHRMRLTMTDDHGNFVPLWATPILSSSRLAESIEVAIRDEQGATAEVDCGQGVRPIDEAGWRCTIEVGGATREVTVRVDPRDASWEIQGGGTGPVPAAN
jgi:Domain of unknown function (DUF4333)